MAYTTINKSSDYFNTKLYTGNGGTQSITGVGFQPDWVWIKNTADTDWHFLTDAVRGVTKTIHSNTNNAESTQASALTAFGTDGFSVGNDTAVNANSENIVAWNWKANGAGSSNTAGSINSTVSVSATSGFSIVKYTGTGANASIGHGLGVAPKVVLIKSLSASEDWSVYFLDTSVAYNNVNNYLELNTSNASAGDSGARFGVYSNFTTSTFGVGNDNATNASGSTYIAYCFRDVQGYSKFGSYVGNGDADGSFIYTGFKPAFVIFKRTDSAVSWSMVDNKRDTYNPTNKRLFPDLSNTENTSLDPFIDLVSNGFKLKASSTAFNGSGNSYIYIAFAEAPLVGTNNVPATAR